MELKQKQLSDIIGINRAAITMAVKRGHLEKNSAGLIDTQNAKNQVWLTTRGFSEQRIQAGLNEIQNKQDQEQKTITPSNPITELKQIIAKKQTQIETGKNPLNTYEQEGIEKPKKEIDDADFENCTGLPARMMDLTIKELVVKYGGPMMLDSWSKILQRLMAANEKDQKIQERRLELIEKDFVISSVITYMNILSDRIFDLAESQNKIIISSVRSDPEKAEAIIKDMRLKAYSKIIKETKRAIEQAIKNMKSKYEKDGSKDSEQPDDTE